MFNKAWQSKHELQGLVLVLGKILSFLGGGAFLALAPGTDEQQRRIKSVKVSDKYRGVVSCH